MSRKPFRPRSIRLIPTEDRLTDASGLGTLIEAFDASSLSKPFADCLPTRSSPRSHGSYRLGLIQLSSFIYGHDSLDDLEEFQEDPALNAIMRGETVSPRTMGDFLRDFDEEHLTKLNNYLPMMAAKIRGHMRNQLPEGLRPSEVPHLSIDSTPHEQTGKKMEGVAWNYDNKWCLDSQTVYDEIGLNYGMQLRPGNTKSGDRASELIEHAFSPWGYRDDKFLSGDAAYCYQDPIRTCLRLRIYFTFTANQATTGWQSHTGEITNWTPWVYSEHESNKAQSKKKELPRVEVGSFLWTPGWADNIRLTIVVKRTWIEEDELSLFGEGHWEYYGVVTAMPMQRYSLQQLIEHHNKRGNCENFIREEKYGYDLKHFPCLKLSANHAYGLLAMVAHNTLRWLAIIEKPERPHFAKKLRRRFIYIPGQVIEHARQLFIKIPHRFYKEVMRIRQAWQLPLYPAPAWAKG